MKKRRSKVDTLANVSVVKKANVYFDGKVTSRTVISANEERITLGVMMPGRYEFETADKEHMELLAGKLEVLLPKSEAWMTIEEGETFDIPAHTKFQITAVELSDYCCSYIK